MQYFLSEVWWSNGVCAKGLELQLLCDSASHHLFASQDKFLAAYSPLISSNHHSPLFQEDPRLNLRETKVRMSLPQVWSHKMSQVLKWICTYHMNGPMSNEHNINGKYESYK